MKTTDLDDSANRGNYAFAALRANGSVVSWGFTELNIQIPPGIAQLQDIISLSSSSSAFAVLRANGQRLAWDLLDRGNNIVHSEYDD
ncbi:hypothetical protein [Photorhabdus aegyptia]|uniref:hypothetical protein n=1 Tax=Photorhabdus aegyptia TaxID=2805098 RepID=UPI000562AB4C|nr:hypothetical protein [Photorhabdus aegyptia]